MGKGPKFATFRSRSMAAKGVEDESYTLNRAVCFAGCRLQVVG